MTDNQVTLEPVAWMYCDDDEEQPCVIIEQHRVPPNSYPYMTETPLYAHPAINSGGEVERVARALMPFSYEAFEHGFTAEDGPGEPNEHCLNAARAALAAMDRAPGVKWLCLTCDGLGKDGITGSKCSRCDGMGHTVEQPPQPAPRPVEDGEVTREDRNNAELLASICQKARHSAASAVERDEALRDAADMLRRFARQQSLSAARAEIEGETWESINEWCDTTFGHATVPQIIARAKEEFTELEAEDADHAIEAADVVICLCRIPGFADALQRKMSINRTRKWRLTGDGTGYHIPDAALSTDQGEG